MRFQRIVCNTREGVQSSLEISTQIYLEEYIPEIQHLRELVLAGDFEEVEGFLESISDSLGAETLKELKAELKTQEYLEALHSQDLSQGNLTKIKTLLAELQQVASRQAFSEANRLLGLRSLADHEKFRGWTLITGRLECFSKIYKHLIKVVIRVIPDLWRTSERKLGLLCHP